MPDSLRAESLDSRLARSAQDIFCTVSKQNLGFIGAKLIIWAAIRAIRYFFYLIRTNLFIEWSKQYVFIACLGWWWRVGRIEGSRQRGGI